MKEYVSQTRTENPVLGPKSGGITASKSAQILVASLHNSLVAGICHTNHNVCNFGFYGGQRGHFPLKVSCIFLLQTRTAAADIPWVFIGVVFF